ncbi:MAG: fatty acid cis/trans isomerase [Gammaproteobacteria bacterium]
MLKHTYLKLVCFILLLVFIAASKGFYNPDTQTAGGAPTVLPQRLLSIEESTQSQQQGSVSYSKDIKPILEARCVVCHACYDAPCQLKLSSFEGLDRGASKNPVYDTERFKADEPTRLFIDATDTAEWRAKSFFPVLNEWGGDEHTELDRSVLAKLLQLKRKQPLPVSGKLDDSFEFELDRPLECPAIEEIEQFQQQHPSWGMPYGLPGLSEEQEKTLLTWLAEGAKFEPRPPLPEQASQAIEKWETFFNGHSNKERLVSRYIYEHLFIGHIHFKGHPEQEFYQLVRSTTPSGQAIAEIDTVRPYESPTTGDFYYRLSPIVSTIVDKNHFVYELSDEKMQRYRELFFEPDYRITSLPSYQADTAANPFKTFIDIPLASRYKFLLDDAQYFFSGFIKGPVCRGQVAINVIQDQFWIVFIDPDMDFVEKSSEFLAKNVQYLSLPGSGGDEIGILDMGKYTDLGQEYLIKKDAFINQSLLKDQGIGLDAIWDGDGNNPNAALTVFRHFDSATVVTGFVGDTPLTGWVVDYPVFERIHYLLVAGFNVFGSSAHQVATRRYMDYLRRDAENNFLRFMPANQRKRIHDNWYQGFGAEFEKLFREPLFSRTIETAMQFKTSDFVAEFFEQVRRRLGTAAEPRDSLNRCQQQGCVQLDAPVLRQDIDRAMRHLAQLGGHQIKALPEVSFVRVITGSPEQDLVYTLVVNKALSNVSFMFVESLRRVPERDTLTVVPGFLGSYPNFFFAVEKERLDDFVDSLKNAQTQEAIDAFYERFGIRRSNPEIWRHVDWFNEQHKRQNGLRSGLFDMNRYQNL